MFGYNSIMNDFGPYNNKFSMSHQKFLSNNINQNLIDKLSNLQLSSTESDNESDNSDEQRDNPAINLQDPAKDNEENQYLDPKAKLNINNESLNYTMSANESSIAHITGNFGGTFSNFKPHIEHFKQFSTFRGTDNISKLLKKFDIDVKGSISNEVVARLAEIKGSKTHSPNLIQTYISIYEEEKKMKDEKIKIAEKINSIFRQYEKQFKKCTKKQKYKKEIEDLLKSNPKYKEINIVFDQLLESISLQNPANSVTLVKLWR